MRMVACEAMWLTREGTSRADAPPAGPPGASTVLSVVSGAGADVIPRVRTIGYRPPRRLGECDPMTVRRTARPRRTHREIANDWFARARQVCPSRSTEQKARNDLRHGYWQTVIDKL